MTESLRSYLLKIAREKIPDIDPSHDIYHAQRVLKNAEYLAVQEKGDLEILIPAALFHDVICYQKNHPKSKLSAQESAEFTSDLLNSLSDYPKNKIPKVYKCINECSFSKGITADLLESKILQDSDRLEATGLISVMRTFCSAGQMKKSLYNYEDPFCENREPESLNYALDLFYARLLKVKDMMNTETAKKIAERRTQVLYDFLENLKKELYDDTAA